MISDRVDNHGYHLDVSINDGACLRVCLAIICEWCLEYSSPPFMDNSICWGMVMHRWYISMINKSCLKWYRADCCLRRPRLLHINSAWRPPNSQLLWAENDLQPWDLLGILGGRGLSQKGPLLDGHSLPKWHIVHLALVCCWPHSLEGRTCGRDRSKCYACLLRYSTTSGSEMRQWKAVIVFHHSGICINPQIVRFAQARFFAAKYQRLSNKSSGHCYWAIGTGNGKTLRFMINHCQWL